MDRESSNKFGIFEASKSVYGVTMSGLVIANGKAKFFFASIKQYLLTQSKAMLIAMTRHFSSLYESYAYDDPTSPVNLFRDRFPGRSENEAMTFKQMEELPKSKISGAHHFHFTPMQVLKSIGRGRLERAIQASRLPKDAEMTFATGMLLWYTSISDQMAELIRGAGIFKCDSVREYVKEMKQLSVEAKSLQNLVTDDLRTVFELEVLVNRIDGVVDWEKEKENRQSINVTNIKDSDVFRSACKIFEDAKGIGRRPKSFSWESYWANRWQWSAAGSIHSQYPRDMEYVIRDQQSLKNKFITISNMPKCTVDYFSDREPQVQGWSSTKYEWGKQRAIYGTDLTSYVLSNFAFYNCENVLPNQFPVGRDANDENVVNRVSGVLNNRMPFCLDFEDFNSQHSSGNMKAVIYAYIETFIDCLTPEQEQAAMWTAASLDKQIINDNVGTKTTYESKGTLLSGWRLTTFMNSVLNYIYTTKLAAEEKRPGDSLHNGDDVLIGVRSMALPQRCMQNAIKYNVRMQSSKCAVGAIAEFLRIDHKQGGNGQYLSRAVATMVHSRIESRVSTDIRDLVQSMENRFADAKGRGMANDIISGLREQYYMRQSVLCDTDVEDIYLIKNAHRVVGGISEEKDSKMGVLITSQLRAQKNVSIPYLPGVNEYANEIHKALKINVSIKTICDRLYDATYEAVSIKDRKMKILRENRDQWFVNVRRIYKAHKGSQLSQNYGKAALVGFALEVLGREMPDATITTILNTSQRPLDLIKHIL
uniref:RNA-directed RNA polymerase n=1 Tax=Xanthophyllomyces dendrorhous virus L2 TaxID=1167692 RepID=H9XW64_9VIRU|nr:RNA-dependent RNA polymerase [Xanthophyllomyces dendrorhous virus L2]